MRKSVFKTVLIFIVLFIAGACSYQPGRDVPKDERKNYYLGPAYFFPDNERILFSFSLIAGGERKYAIYDLKSGDFSVSTVFPLRPPSSCSFPQAFSWDGKRAVCSYFNNLYVTDTDGGNQRRVTSSTEKVPEDPPDAGYGRGLGLYAGPSFSPNGKRIIFMRPATWIWESLQHKQLGQKKNTSWDIYDVDIETGAERRLTNFGFYEMSRPFYLPDGKRFIFSGAGIKPDNHTYRMDRSVMEEIKKQNSIIYIMDGKKNVLWPAFESPGRYARDPVVAMDGAIVYKAIVNELDKLENRHRFVDNYDLFIKKGKAITRLTHMRTYIYSHNISPDGSRIVFMEDQSRRFNWNIWVVNSDGTGLTKIEIPWGKVPADIGTTEFNWPSEQRKTFFSLLADVLLIGFLITIILFHRRWDFLWPRLTSPVVARRTAYYGLFVAFFGVYEIYADACVRGSQYFLTHPLKLLFETALYIIIGLGIWRLLRVASLAILGVHIYGIIATFLVFIIYYKRFPPLVSIILALFLILFSLNCIRGTFVWHMFREGTAKALDDTCNSEEKD